jgi:hypothetical protein
MWWGLLLLVAVGFAVHETSTTATTTGVDGSWPMQHTNVASALTSTYMDYMEGCYSQFGKGLCDKNELDRISLNLLQPSAQGNFTATGYEKVKAPVVAFEKLQSFYEKNSALAIQKDWDRGTIHHTNYYWEEGSSTPLLLLDDPDGGGMPLVDRRQLLRQVQAAVERWSGVPVMPVIMHGIRVFHSGSIVAPYVDR